MTPPGVRMILRYNWPLYTAGVGTAVAGVAVARNPQRHPAARAAATAAALGAGWLACASMAVSWWVYDRSELYRWTWLRRAVPVAPSQVVVVHAGLDEASAPVRRAWPAAAVTSVDVHRGAVPATASLRRARHRGPAGQGAALRDTAAADAVVGFLSAHELRAPRDRAALFATIHDVLRPGGRLVLVEHVRDVVNALAYGPAVGHFYSARTWRRAIRDAGLTLVAEERITPFVVLLTAEKQARLGR